MPRGSRTKRRGGLGAAAIACLLPFVLSVPASGRRAPSPPGPFGAFVLVSDGDRVVCREAPVDSSLARRDVNALHVLRRPHAEKTGPGLTIVLRGTDQLEQSPAAKAAFVRAAETWERTIAGTPITIVVDIDYGATYFGQPFPSNVLGVTDPQVLLAGDDYAFIRSHLIAEAASDDEAALYARLPNRSVPTDLGATRDVYAPTAVLRATHFLPAEAKPSAEHARLGNPPALAISSAYAYDFDPLDGIDASARDFEAVVLHELGHVLGFTSIVGGHETNAGFPVAVSMLDLFRFRPGVRADSFPTARRILSSGGEQVFFGGGEALELSTGRQDASGGDGHQASHWKDESDTGVFIGLMHPALKLGVHEELTSNDLLAFDRIGYTLAVPTGAIASLSAVLAGDVVTFSGTFAGAPVAATTASVTMLDANFRPVHEVAPFPVALGDEPSFALGVPGFDAYQVALAARLTLFDASGAVLGSALADFGAGDDGGPSIRRTKLGRASLTLFGEGFADGASVEVAGVPVDASIRLEARRGGTRLVVHGSTAALHLRHGYTRVRVTVNGARSNLVAVFFE